MTDRDEEKQIASKDEQQVTVGPSGAVESPAVIAAVAPATPVLEQQLEYVPDGGKAAWTVVLGSTLALFASAGMINAYVRPFSAYLNHYKGVLTTTTTYRVRFKTTTSPPFSRRPRRHQSP